MELGTLPLWKFSLTRLTLKSEKKNEPIDLFFLDLISVVNNFWTEKKIWSFI